MSSKVTRLKLKGPGGIIRELHHVKVLEQDEADPTKIAKPKYERALMLYRPELAGRSCYIPGSCAWKYLDPHDNNDMAEWDLENFSAVCQDLSHGMKMQPYGNFTMEIWAIKYANLVHAKSKFMRMTGYSLAKFLQLLDVEVTEKRIYALLNYVQDGLRDLQIMALPLPEEETEVGEATYTLYRNDEPISRDVPLTIREGEMKTGVIH